MADLGDSDPSKALPPPGVHITAITYDFNRIGEAEGTADHGFLTFHLDNNTVQTLGSHPAGPSGGLTLLSHYDVVDAHGLTARFDVSVPHGMTADSYARSLVRAAENYNTHPLPYSPIGEEGYNSTSSTSSSLAHVGGTTGVADLKRIAADIGVSTRIETNDNVSRTRADLAGIGAIDFKTVRGREVATASTMLPFRRNVSRRGRSRRRMSAVSTR